MKTSSKFIKDPLFIGPVFLKKPSRAKALTYVLPIALLILNRLTRRIYEVMESGDELLIIPGKEKTFSPTAKKILEILEMFLTMTTVDPNRCAFVKCFKLLRVLKLTSYHLIFISTSKIMLNNLHKLTTG